MFLLVKGIWFIIIMVKVPWPIMSLMVIGPWSIICLMVKGLWPILALFSFFERKGTAKFSNRR